MNDITTTTIVAPETIARSLESVVDMIKGQIDDSTANMVENVLRLAARNTRMLFEFTSDEEGRFRPRNMGEVMYLVDLLMRGNMAPSSYNNQPAAIALGVMKAVEIGVEPISGIANIMIVNNRPSVWGDLAQALIQRSGLVKKQVSEKIGEWPEGDTELAKWPLSCGWRVTTWRVGQEEAYVGEFTVAAAKRANLWMNPKKQPWITDPDAMLFNRARAKSQRAGFADGLYGMAIAEEQNDILGVEHVSSPLLLSSADDDEPVTKLEAPKPEVMHDFSSGEPIESVPVGTDTHDQRED